MATLNTLPPATSSRLGRIIVIATLVVAGVLASLVFGSSTAQATVGGQSEAHPPADVGKPIPGHYIVRVEQGNDPLDLATDHGANPKFVYRDVINGFAAELNDHQADALRRNPHVASVSQDVAGGVDVTQSLPGSPYAWGLDRIDQRRLPLSRTYTYTHTGAGVNAYVIDSGIDTDHPQFGARAFARFDNARTSGTAYGEDCHGHGTHVAGTIGGRTFGVAKQVRLHSVKVADCAGDTSASQIIEGIEWVEDHAVRPAVANISLHTPVNADVDAAVARLADSGVFVAVSAGNSSADACTAQSPARARAVFTVASSNSNDARRSTSNYGPCVEAYAPGGEILSADVGGGSRVRSGTSMASPHVAGVVALGKDYIGGDYLGGDYISSADWSQWVINASTRDVITSNNTRTATPNRLLNSAGM